MPNDEDPFMFLGKTFEERYPVATATPILGSVPASAASLMPTPAEREQERLRNQQQLLAQKERLRRQISDINKRMQTRPPPAMQQAQRGAAVSSPFGPIGSAMPMPQMPQVPPEVQQATVERMEAHRQEISKLERSILLGNQKLQQNPNNIALRQSVEAAQRRLLELSTMEEDQTLESAMPVGPVRP